MLVNFIVKSKSHKQDIEKGCVLFVVSGVMNIRGTRAKCERTKIMNPLDAASTKDKS
jgi:hypothetical protein